MRAVIKKAEKLFLLVYFIAVLENNGFTSRKVCVSCAFKVLVLIIIIKGINCSV